MMPNVPSAIAFSSPSGSGRHIVDLKVGRSPPFGDLQVLAEQDALGAGAQVQDPKPGEFVTAITSDTELPAAADRGADRAYSHIDSPFPEESKAAPGKPGD